MIQICCSEPFDEAQLRQAMAWQRLPVEVAPVLPGTLPVLDWFAAEQGFAGATCAGGEGAATLPR